MKLFKNKIFLSIIIIIFLLFLLQFYFISNSYKRDTNSYITLIYGAGKITRNEEVRPIILKINTKEKIINGDVVNTIGDSLAVIEWGDKSITRLGANSKIFIKENFVSDDLSKINISFELLKGKTWSNVISIMFGDSYFKQDIKGTTAAVRGTIFEVNYDKDYMLVHSHEVDINKNGETKKLFPGEVFSISQFSFENLKIIIDETFIKLNKNLDKEYLNKLREDFLASIKNGNPLNLVSNLNIENKVYDMIVSGESKENLEKYISSLPEDKKQKIINSLNTLNQTLNFENGENKFLYNLKLNTKSLIIDNSQDQNLKEILVKYSVYDLSEFFSFGNFSQDILNNTLQLVSNNREYIENLKGNYEILNQIFSIKKEDLTSENLKSKLIELDASGKKILNNGLNKLLKIYKK